MSSNARQQSELGLYFVNQHRGQWASLGMVLLLLVAAIDYATGFKLRLTIMYLVPVLVLTWVMGRLCGVVLGIVASTCWAYRDTLSGRYIDFPSLLYWDWASALTGILIIVIGGTESRRPRDTPRFEAPKDALTGLVNKGGFYQVVGSEIEVCRRYKRTLSI